MVVTSVSIGGIMVRTPAHSARDVSLIPTRGLIFPQFDLRHDTWCCDHDHVQGGMDCVVVNLLCLCM